jgi:crotonobetaine/carnitine-CoA ligase
VIPPAVIDGDLTLPELLAEAARRWPAKAFLRIGQETVTFHDFADGVERLAGALHAGGLRPGDRVCVLMHNSLACLRSWFAVNRAGAVWVPLNTDFTGEALAHALRLAGPRLVICDDALAERLGEPRAAGAVESCMLIIAHAPEGAMTGQVRLEALGSHGPAPPPGASPADLSALLYTSGTTGRSKACMLSHRYFTSQARIAIRDFGLRHDDVLYCPFPLFHADATALTTVPALITGATAAIGRRFSASRFWQEVRDAGATVFDFMGATLTILGNAEPRPDDADNPVRLAWGVPVPSWAPDFEKRFGLQILEVYGSTESNLPATQRFDRERVPGSCGQTTPEFEIRIADDHDDEAEPGQAGEILTRPRTAHTMFEGYFGMTGATAEAFRGLWFHTGDLGRMDAEGNLFFLGRKSDSIRRRGENISAFEVEEAVNANVAVLESAAYGVPSELTEEDVKVSVVLRPGAHLTPCEMLRFCAGTMPRFQVPRYVEIVAELPKTPTGKVAKELLRSEPLTSATWDRQAGGFVPRAAGSGTNRAAPDLATD